MQLIWLSGPAGRMVSWSVSRRKLALIAVATAITCVAAGGAVQTFGLRLAIEWRPEWAEWLGGVTSKAEQLRIEQHYKTQIGEMQSQLDQLRQQVQSLENSRREVLEPLRPDAVPAGRNAVPGQGGPLQLLNQLSPFDWFAPSLARRMGRFQHDVEQLDTEVANLTQRWEEESQWLSRLPLGRPIGTDASRSSTFGRRFDPFTGQVSMHEGHDFVAPSGTPIQASAPGKVLRAGPAGPYGNLVEIDHGMGFTTRYAHLRLIKVQAGQTVQRGDEVGELGSTGRSTGPHLHFEVRVHGEAIPPTFDNILRFARREARNAS